MPAMISPSGPSGSAIRPLPSVVPMLAPMITDIAGLNATTPALTSPTTITVIAVLDCSTPVISVPEISPLIGVPATLPRMLRIRCTARFWMPSDMNSSPSMKMPSPPITGTAMSLNTSIAMSLPWHADLVGSAGQVSGPDRPSAFPRLPGEG